MSPGRPRSTADDDVAEIRPRLFEIVRRRPGRMIRDANDRSPRACSLHSRRAPRLPVVAGPMRKRRAAPLLVVFAQRNASTIDAVRRRAARRSTRRETSRRRAPGSRRAPRRRDRSMPVPTSALISPAPPRTARSDSASPLSGKTVTIDAFAHAGRHVEAGAPAPRRSTRRPACPASRASRRVRSCARSVDTRRSSSASGAIVDARPDGRLHVLEPLDAVQRRIGLHRDQPGSSRSMLAQAPADADERAARAEAGDEVRHAAVRSARGSRRRSSRSARASWRRCCTGRRRSSDPGSSAYRRRASRIAPSEPSIGIGEHELGAVGAQRALAARR